MSVDIADSTSVERLILDEMQDFGVGCHMYLGQFAERPKDLSPAFQTAKGHLPDNGGVAQDLPLLKQMDQPVVACAQMIDPD
jgi:hypothetical protein